MVWERTKNSHFKIASISFQRKTWKRCGNAVPTRSHPTLHPCWACGL